jgi:Holliday junction DNA helicase RuvA
VGVAAAWEAASAEHAPAPRDLEMNDAMLALIALGYKQVDAHKAVKAVTAARGNEELSSDALLREALKHLAS